jgi:hypothetical protein
MVPVPGKSSGAGSRHFLPLSHGKQSCLEVIISWLPVSFWGTLVSWPQQAHLFTSKMSVPSLSRMVVRSKGVAR